MAPRGPLGPMIFGIPKMAAGAPGFGSVLKLFFGAFSRLFQHQFWGPFQDHFFVISGQVWTSLLEPF